MWSAYAHCMHVFLWENTQERCVSSVASVAQCGSSPDGEELPVDP